MARFALAFTALMIRGAAALAGPAEEGRLSRGGPQLLCGKGRQCGSLFPGDLLRKSRAVKQIENGSERPGNQRNRPSVIRGSDHLAGRRDVPLVERASGRDQRCFQRISVPENEGFLVAGVFFGGTGSGRPDPAGRLSCRISLLV